MSSTITVTRHEVCDEQTRPYVPDDVLGTFTVPALDEGAMRAAMGRAIVAGRVGRRREDAATVARILVEHGAWSTSTGGYALWQAAIDAMPEVVAARAELDATDAPLQQRWEALGVTQARLQALDRAYEHGGLPRVSPDEERAFGVNLKRNVAHGRLWWIEEQAWAALRKAWLPRVEAIAREEADALLASNRDVNIIVRGTTAERARVKALADAAGQSVSDYIRQRIGLA